MNYWLMKSEPGECSVDDVLAANNSSVPWVGVRNYQARNFMRDAMQVGDGVLFYHSSCAEPGIAGIARVASSPYPDPTQFDLLSPYYDAKSKPAEPRWILVDVQVIKKTRIVGQGGEQDARAACGVEPGHGIGRADRTAAMERLMGRAGDAVSLNFSRSGGLEKFYKIDADFSSTNY